MPTPTLAPTATPEALDPVRVVLGGIGDARGEFQDARTMAVALRGAGRIYVGEYTGGRVQVFDSDGEYLSEWNTGGGETPLKKLAADPSGVVYAVFDGNIYRFDGATGASLGQLNYEGGQGFQDVAVLPDGGLAATWNKDWRGGLFVDFNESQDDLVIFDREGSVVRVVPKILSEVGGGNAELETNVAVDNEGNFYLSGLNNRGVFKFSPLGRFATVIGAERVGFADALALDENRRLFVAANHEILVFDRHGAYVGSSGYWGTAICVVDADTVLVLNDPQVIELSVAR